MNIINILGNCIWFICGGIYMGLLWFLIGALAYISIIGIPWGKACFVIGSFSFFPFGRDIVNRRVVTKTKDIGTGFWGSIGNIIWFFLAGWGLALGHLISGLLCMVTIIGIPFGFQHFKLAGLSLFPIGKTIVKI